MFIYLFIFDVGDDRVNLKIIDILGDRYLKEVKIFGKNVSIYFKVWLYIWVDDNNNF